MKEVTLKPVRDFDSYSKDMMRVLDAEIYWSVYKPIFDILEGKDTREAARETPLLMAFRRGVLRYNDGFVFGKFSAALSKALVDLGAVFNRTRKAYKIPLTAFPVEIRTAMTEAKMIEERKVQAIQKKISDPVPLVPSVRRTELAEKTIDGLETQFAKVTPKEWEIPMTMTDAVRQTISKEYLENLDISINGWKDEAVLRLRDKVGEFVASGRRAEELKDVIQAEYGISRNKAKMIARQETSLMVSKYRQTRYEDAGLTHYRWLTSQDERVRPDHKLLNNKVFRWDDPPITDRTTGKRNNPGEDFACRCVGAAVVRVGQEWV